MKQNITIEQLNELSIENAQKLANWCHKKGWGKHLSQGLIREDYKKNIHCFVPTLLVGQMIEFLDWDDIEIYTAKPPTRYMKIHHPDKAIQQWVVQDGDYENANKVFIGNSICDVLWEAVKEVLDTK